MATVTSADYDESIATRTDDRPRERAQLSDRLMDAMIGLEEAVHAVGEDGVSDLEGWGENRLALNMTDLRQRVADFEAALVETGRFLQAKGEA